MMDLVRLITAVTAAYGPLLVVVLTAALLPQLGALLEHHPASGEPPLRSVVCTSVTCIGLMASILFMLIVRA